MTLKGAVLSDVGSAASETWFDPSTSAAYSVFRMARALQVAPCNLSSWVHGASTGIQEQFSRVLLALSLFTQQYCTE